MRIMTLILSAVLVTLISSEVSAATQKPAVHGKEVCKIVTGYGTAIGTGSTHHEALENARLSCGSAMIDQYFAQRREIPDDVKEDLALACVNLDCQ